MADGDVPITFASGAEFGPHAESLGVPEELQSTEWAAAYDEIATAMTYIFRDINGNGTQHEMSISPAGDVPPFFTYDAYYESLGEMYEAIGNHSPHNDLIGEHVASLDLEVDGAEIETHLAFLDAVPRIPDIAVEMATGDYDKVVVVPLLLSSSTHTQEVAEQVEEAVAGMGDVDVVVTEPFFEVPFMRDRIKRSVLSMADYIRAAMPADVSDDEVGVVLGSHGTPYTPAHSAFGWQAGEIFSNLGLTEDAFHEEIASEMPWPTQTGRMNYATPSIEDALTSLEAEAVSHVLIVPSAFPTTAVHTMWHVAEPAVARAVTPDEGVVVHERDSGMHVYHSALGYTDLEEGRELFRSGLSFMAEVGVLEALEPGIEENL